jgi:hypothetical protein
MHDLICRVASLRVQRRSAERGDDQRSGAGAECIFPPGGMRMRKLVNWRVALAALCIIGVSVLASSHSALQPMTMCARVPGDSARLVHLAEDTIASLRGIPQGVIRVRLGIGGYRVTTEDPHHDDVHDGGVVIFDCTGRISTIWLDGG